MGFLKTLLSALGSQIDSDIVIGGDKIVNNNDQRTVIVRGNGEELVHRSESREVVDINALDPKQREEAKQALRDEWKSAEELFRESTAEDEVAIEATVNDEQITETLDYFQPIIPSHYFGTLEAALHMRKQMEIMDNPSRDWVRSRRKDIAEKFDGDSYHLINLCSAGYFDEGRYLRKLYEEMREEDGYKEGDYANVFEQIVAQGAFTIFVSQSDQPSDVKQEIYSTIQNRDRHDVRVEFVDVRGMGYANRQKIDTAIERIASEVGDFQINVRNEKPEKVVRIDPDTVNI